jgi:gamma-glutamylcyclotransferase (GGCT)/AIG2-like uncharacterized protein YtfP
MVAMRFFFYGTLLAGSANAVAARIHARLAPLGPASAQGRLYVIADAQGWFPALVEGAGKVRGMLYAAAPAFTAADLAAMDAYEDFDPAAPEASLYLRRTVTVTPDAGMPGEAEVYVWNRALPDGAQLIDDGDFRAWLEGAGLSQFTGLREA